MSSSKYINEEAKSSAGRHAAEFSRDECIFRTFEVIECKIILSTVKWFLLKGTVKHKKVVPIESSLLGIESPLLVKISLKGPGFLNWNKCIWLMLSPT